jgi:Cys-tRNA(Pro)/Cys-tRNA(Cys) deacylase
MNGDWPSPAIAALQAAVVDYVTHDYTGRLGDRATPADVAALLGIAPGRILKTLVVQTGATRRPLVSAEGENPLVVAVLPFTTRLNLKAVSDAVGSESAVLADRRLVEAATGYSVGAVSPLGMHRPLAVFVEESALDHPTVFVSSGRLGLEIELAPGDLVRATRARAAPIAEW